MATTSVDTAFEKPLTATRIQSVDLLRGLIMVIMVIDHVRVYSGISPGGPDAGVFFTRWITHYCAPGFVFLAGTSAFLYGHKINDTGKLARYLLTRGLLLVILEITVIRFFWTFNLNFSEFFLAGVIWMLGWCMVLLAAFVGLRAATIGIIGLIIASFQNAFALVPNLLPQASRASFGRFWEFIYTSGFETWPGITILYVLVPWIGVMMAGYGFGVILLMEPAKRRRICLWLGLSAIAVFVIVGCILVFQKPVSPDEPPFIFKLLNQRKYPASQLYLLMTLGPIIALVPFAEKAKGWFARVLGTFGKVPMFFYLLHILIIHLSAFVVNSLLYGSIHQEWYATSPYTYMPEKFERWGLPLLYLVFVIDVTLLYFACSAYARYKQAHPEKQWLKYI